MLALRSPMSTFTDPPLLSPNTVAAIVMRVARAFGLALPALGKIIGHANKDKVKAKVFEGYVPNDSDIFVTTYSKSGTNWALQIATQIAWRGEAEFEHIHEVVAWPESIFAGIVALDDRRPIDGCPTGKRAIKTVSDTAFVPYSKEATYITVLRDPKDVLVSAFHFLNGVFGLTGHVTIEQWLALFLDPSRFPAGSWPLHAASFWAWRDRPNVEVLFYADMKADLQGAVEKVAKAMRVELSKAELERVVERCGFEWMRAREERFAPPKMRFTPSRGRMLREGKVGGSKALLTDEQGAAVDTWCLQQLEELGSDLPYAEKFRLAGRPSD